MTSLRFRGYLVPTIATRDTYLWLVLSCAMSVAGFSGQIKGIRGNAYMYFSTLYQRSTSTPIGGEWHQGGLLCLRYFCSRYNKGSRLDKETEDAQERILWRVHRPAVCVMLILRRVKWNSWVARTFGSRSMILGSAPSHAKRPLWEWASQISSSYRSNRL